MQKEFETRFPNALEISLKSLPVANLSQTISILENTKKPKEEVVAKVGKVKTTETASSPIVTISEISSSSIIATTNKAEVFRNGKISVQKINMGIWELCSLFWKAESVLPHMQYLLKPASKVFTV